MELRSNAEQQASAFIVGENGAKAVRHAIRNKNPESITHTFTMAPTAYLISTICYGSYRLFPMACNGK